MKLHNSPSRWSASIAKSSMRLLLCLVVLAMPACAQAADDEAVVVAPFKLVSWLLVAVLAEQSCPAIAIDQAGFDRFIGESGIALSELSRDGPHAAEIAKARRRLKRIFARRNAQTCELAMSMFGPQGTALKGILKPRQTN